MTASNEAARSDAIISSGKPARPQRRVGTFTLGVTLVATGAAMLTAMFFPAIPPERFLQASPVILILLGLEVLLSLPKNGKIKYDWLGMLLCILLTSAAMGLYTASWYLSEYGPGYSRITHRYASDNSYSMAFETFSGPDSHVLHLQSGDVLRAAFTLSDGFANMEVLDPEDRTLAEYTVSPGSWTRLLDIPAEGDYWVQIDMDFATGSFLFGTIEPDSPESPETSESPENPEQP